MDNEYFQDVDAELIDRDFDHIDPYGEIMEESGNGEHTMDDVELNY